MTRRKRDQWNGTDFDSGFYVIRRRPASEFEDTLAGPFATPTEALVARESIYAEDRSTPLEIRRSMQYLSKRRLARALRAELLAHMDAAGHDALRA